jgi:hypothetical protein
MLRSQIDLHIRISNIVLTFCRSHIQVFRFPVYLTAGTDQLNQLFRLFAAINPPAIAAWL